MFALAARQAIGKRCNEIVQGKDDFGRICGPCCVVQQAALDHHPVENFDLQMQTADGMRWCNVSVLIADADSISNPYSIHIVRQIDTRKRLELLVRDFTKTEAQPSAGTAAATGAPKHFSDRNSSLSSRARNSYTACGRLDDNYRCRAAPLQPLHRQQPCPARPEKT